MNSNMQGHNHGGKSHLYGMLGIGAVVLVGLLLAGKSFGEALLLAALLACPVMMIGMLFMMHGNNSHQHDGNTPTDHHDHDTPPARSNSSEYTEHRTSNPADRN